MAEVGAVAVSNHQARYAKRRHAGGEHLADAELRSIDDLVLWFSQAIKLRGTT